MPIHLEKILQELSTKKDSYKVYVPCLWFNHKDTGFIEVEYASFLAEKINEILHTRNQGKTSNKNWTKKAIVYNLFVRFFSAFDHDQDGVIGNHIEDITLNKQGIRETGTLLKTIALLPYLKSLGVNTIHLLPITEIGIDGRKGDMGSPYAIKNPFRIDPNIGDPIVTLSVEDQYKGLIEAAHFLGIRIVQEFIFRTASIDADWTKEHPEWFYWIKDQQKYGPPKFTKKELEHILKVPKGKGKFIAPDHLYRTQFEIPTTGTDYKKLKIASAFADWPPNDLQPPWSDVTYLRLYNYDYTKANNFNYIAYNTIRYYDPELAKKEYINDSLWNIITEIIPYYQENFGIDGAMIDMGHALPNSLKNKIIKKARSLDPSFAFWDENFSNKMETKKDGYDAVIGDCWYKITKRNGFRKIIQSLNSKYPLPFFGTSETHNSPRFGFGNIKKKKASWILFNVLPDAIPFLHNGFELDEHLPVNTGLNFNKVQIDDYANKKLPLFYKNALHWDSQSNIISFIQIIASIRKRESWIFDKKDVELIKTNNPKVLGFIKKQGKKQIIILFNTNFNRKEAFDLPVDFVGEYNDLILKRNIQISENNMIKKGDVLFALQNPIV